MKTYIISGAGAGIGRAIAKSLSKNQENHLILISRNQESLSETKSCIENSDQHTVLPCSVTDATGLARSFKELQLDQKNVSGVIANAGIGGPNIYGENDSWGEIIDINVKGTYVLANEALPYLNKSTNTYRHVIVVSSILAHMGVPFHSAYCASKAAVLGLMRSWASQWAADKILVNAICPGWVETQMAKNGIQGIADAMQISYEKALAGQMKLVPLGKMAEPKEIGALVKFLVSNEQTSITGEEFQINCGALMH